MIYGNRTAESTMLATEITALERQFAGRLTVHHVLSRAGTNPRRVDGSVVLELESDAAAVDAWFLCGPQAMVDDVQAQVCAAGAAADRVHTELFHIDSDAAAEILVDLDSQVTVALDGVESTFALRSTGETILDAVLQRGIDAPYSCAGGACGTCRAKVLLGRAVMDQNHALSPDEVERGYVLTCQAHPTSEELRLDYDA